MVLRRVQAHTCSSPTNVPHATQEGQLFCGQRYGGHADATAALALQFNFFQLSRNHALLRQVAVEPAQKEIS